MQELKRIGADIEVEAIPPRESLSQLAGATVMATYRALLGEHGIAGMIGRPTTVERVYHLDRGYERSRKTLSSARASAACDESTFNRQTQGPRKSSRFYTESFVLVRLAFLEPLR